MSEDDPVYGADPVYGPSSKLRWSERRADLYKALSAAQGEFVPAPKDAENPHFKSSYADLADVVLMASPVLAKHGLCVIQAPGWDAELQDAVLTTHIAHISGQWVEWESRLFIPKLDPQGQGSAITYGRRYNYTAGLGIVADKDDDGERAVSAMQREPVETEDDRKAKADGWAGVQNYLDAKDNVAQALARLKGSGQFTEERAKALWKEWVSGAPKTLAQHSDWWQSNIDPFLSASVAARNNQEVRELLAEPSEAESATQPPLSEPDEPKVSRAPSAKELEKAGVNEEDMAAAWATANAWRDQGKLGQALGDRKVSQDGTPDERMNRLVSILALEFAEIRQGEAVMALPLPAEPGERED